MADVLDRLFYAGEVPPEAVDELSYGRDMRDDCERLSQLHEDKPEHVGHQDGADK